MFSISPISLWEYPSTIYRLKTKARLFGNSLINERISSTDIEVSAISILKVGFKIDQYFDLKLNTKNKIVTVTLPEPTVLSHEVYPRIDKLDIGWFREIEKILKAIASRFLVIYILKPSITNVPLCDPERVDGRKVCISVRCKMLECDNNVT